MHDEDAPLKAPPKAPLVVTLELGEPHQTYFNRLRQTYFPEERNYLEAHLTLFHQLPGAEQEAISRTLHEMSHQQSELELRITEVKNIGRGVAFVLNSEALMAIHQHLAKWWHNWLTPQDRQKLWPHITVQNKVSAEEAKTTFHYLIRDFEPFTATGTGLRLWYYQGGPWELVQTFPFGKTEKSYLSG